MVMVMPPVQLMIRRPLPLLWAHRLKKNVIVVTVAPGALGTNKYFFDGVEAPELQLVSGQTYKFDLSSELWQPSILFK